MDVIPQLALVIGVICSAIMGVGKRGGNFVMGALSLILYLVFQTFSGSLSTSQEELLRQIPSTIEDAVRKLNLNCKTTPFAVCACHCMYPPTSADNSARPSYPIYCTNFLQPGVQCREPLLDPDSHGNHRPKKLFHYHSFHDYLTGLLSRNDIEKIMDQSCDRLASSVSAGSPKPRFVWNPFEADFLHEFRGPDLDKLFIDRGNEGRYAFALHVDFFNPEGMNLRGARSSSGIISMACLNLPLEIRYKPEKIGRASCRERVSPYV